MPPLVAFFHLRAFFPPARISALDAAPAVSALSAMQRPAYAMPAASSDAILAAGDARGGDEAEGAGLVCDAQAGRLPPETRLAPLPPAEATTSACRQTCAHWKKGPMLRGRLPDNDRAGGRSAERHAMRAG